MLMTEPKLEKEKQQLLSEMKEANCEEMSEADQFAFVQSFFERNERTSNASKMCIKLQTETFFACEQLEKIVKNVALSIKPEKLKKTDDEYLQDFFVKRTVSLMDSIQANKFLIDFQETQPLLIKIDTCEAYYILRLTLNGFREELPRIAFGIDQVLFQMSEEMLDHEYCQNCDFCKHKTLEDFRIYQDALFNTDSKNFFEMLRVGDKNDFNIARMFSEVRQKFYEFRYYIDRLIDVSAEKCDMTQNPCDHCKSGGVERHNRIMEKYQNAANN